MTHRKIIHIDMDAFYASVEQRDFPEYRDKPVVVGGKPNRRGVVAACSYEARKFGIHSAMPSARAQRLCPQAVFLPPRFDVYKDCSRQIRAVFRQFTDRIEPLSLDEAFLDVSNSPQLQGSATLIAREIKKTIRDTLGLTASAGVSYNKLLAKIASDMDKPDGLFVIKPEHAEEFIAELPVRKFFGIGRVTEAKMHRLGIYLGADLKQCGKEELRQLFGKSGLIYYQMARGIDPRPVRASRRRKSISAETTFAEDLTDMPVMREKLEQLVRRIQRVLADRGLRARTVTLKVRYQDFKQITRAQTVDPPVTQVAEIMNVVLQLTGRTEMGERPVRLLGVGLSGFGDGDDKQQAGEPQLSLFD